MYIIDPKTEIKIHQYNPQIEIIKPTPDMIDFATFIEDLEIEKRKCYLGPSTKEEVVANTASFFNRHFKLNRIPYKGIIRNKIDVQVLRHVPGTKLPLKFHNSLIRYIDPFELPLLFTSKELIECMVVENTTFIQNEDFMKNMQVSYREIILPNQITELTESSYVHEITHTQLTHQKGIVKEYFNSEVLPIFLELLNIHESEKHTTLEPLQDAIRLVELYQQLYLLEEHNKGIKEVEEDDLINSSKYTQSIFIALGLFTNYYYGSPSLKKYILNSIQNIFNGDLQLEELLDEFELSIATVTKDENVKKYLKR